jgi:hypothetical protein
VHFEYSVKFCFTLSFAKVLSGVDVMITRFGGKNWRASQKAMLLSKFLHILDLL